MGTRTWSRKGVLTAAGRRRQASLAGNVNEDTLSLDPVTKSLADADFSMGNQANIYAAEDMIRNEPKFKPAFDAFGLDMTNDEDVAMFASLIGAFGDDGDNNVVRVSASTYQGANYSETEIDVVLGTDAADVHRIFRITPNSIEVDNQSFENRDAAAKGQGYAMLVRQANALRVLAARLGKKDANVSVFALSSADGEWSGAHVWPRIGYDFDLTASMDLRAVRAAALARGFQSERTSDLMRERNDAGELGFDVWRDIVTAAVKNQKYTDEIVIEGKMRVTDDNNTGLQVLLEYGKNKSILKSGSDDGDMNDIFNLTPADEAKLRDAWIAVGRKK